MSGVFIRGAWHGRGMRVAGIDCGTNSIRLLIAEADVSGLRDIVRTMEIVRLGQGVDKTGEFAPIALERTLSMVDEYGRLCREYGVSSIRFAATSATRDVHNRDIFLDGVRECLGVDVQVLSGEEEARTSFAGAASVLGDYTSGPVIAVDLGGGSTEIILGDMRGGVSAAYSMDIGSVRIHERHLRSNPPTPTEIEGARRDIRAALDEAERHVPFGQARDVIGLAGTVTSVTAKFLGLDEYDSSAVHGTRMSLGEIERTCEWFFRSPTTDIAALGYMHPGRVDVIGSGALIWSEVIARLAERIREACKDFMGAITSEHDILDGLALWAYTEPQAPAL